MIAMGLCTILAFGLLLLKLSPTWRMRILGYDFAADIAMTGGLIALFGNGTISGLMASITAGLFFSIALLVAKRCWQYQRLERHGWRFRWVTHEGPWRYMARRYTA